MMTLETFKDLHRKTVIEFLSNVVIIDDSIVYGDYNPDTVPDVINDPGDHLFDAPDKDVNNKNSGAAKAGENPIDSIALTKAFADKEISCVTIHWSGDPKTKDVPKLCGKADVAVFDWDLGEGNTSLPLITKQFENTKNSFQYIVIYTAKNEHKDIHAELIKKFKDEFTIDPIATKKNYIDFAFSDGGTLTHRIEIISKLDNDTDLCNELIDGFTAFSEGFMRRMVLSSVTSIRKNIFKLLAIYPSDLDKAYISHFFHLLTQKKTTSIADIGFHDYAVSSFVNNIQDIVLYSELVKEDLDRAAIGVFLEKEEKFKIHISGGSPIEKMVNVLELLEITEQKGRSDFLCTAKNTLSMASLSIDQKLNEILVSQDCCINRKTFSKNTCHPLKFGTIIKTVNLKEGEVEQYYLCLQPLCDSIRLKNSVTFPFVELTVKNISSKMQGFIVKNGATLINLCVQDKPHQNLHSFKFDADENTTDVRCSSDQIFKDIDDNQYEWTAELRLHHTQNISHSIASQGTRIGSDKFEWYRQRFKD